MTVKDIPTGFPRNLTFSVTPDELKKITGQTSENDNVKVILSCSKEEASTYTVQKISKLIGRSRVTVVYDIPKENHSRSPDIVGMLSPDDKLREYFRVNGLKDDETLHPLLKELDESLSIEYTFPCHMFRLVRLELRGAIGFKEGIGKDEFSVDFSSFVPGIVALCGDCGRGKTTLIENCHPFLQMLTRSGKLQNHFFLKDSYRRLTYQDEEGTYYYLDIQIDGKNKSGKVLAFAYTGKSLDDLKPVPGLNGNVVPYEKWCAETFGSIEMFLRTSFFTKGDTGSVPDLSEATKGEKRALFNSLLGLERLSALASSAREKRKAFEQEAKSGQAGIDSRDFDLEIGNARSELEATVSDIESLKEKIEAAEKELDSMKSNGLSVDYRTRIAKGEENLLQLNRMLSRCRDAEKAVDEWNLKKEEFSRHENDRELLAETESRLEKKRREFEGKRRDLDRIETELKECEFSLKSSQMLLKEQEKNLPEKIDDSCPTCGQRLPADKIVSLQSDLERKKAEVEDRRTEIVSIHEKIGELETAKGMFIESDMNPLESDIEGLEAKRLELTESVRKLDDIERLKLKAESYGDCKPEDIESLESQIRDCEVQIASDREMLERGADEMAAFEAKKNEAKELKESMASMMLRQGELSNEIVNLEKGRKKNDEAKKALSELKKKAESYGVLEKAFGADGIQALELEAASPEIADITNGILHRAYGDRFKIDFQTLRLGASNNLIEDFNIAITNVETGTTKPLEWLSGGESTWIKEALFHAFSIIRAKKQKSGFLTRFLDEADGSLDPDSRLKFLQLIRAVHEEEKSELTVLITHSTELKALIEQKIEL